MTAGGNTFPRYCITGGIGFPGGKNKNGQSLVKKIVPATAAMITSERATLTGMMLYLLFLFCFFIQKLSARKQDQHSCYPCKFSLHPNLPNLIESPIVPLILRYFLQRKFRLQMPAAILSSQMLRLRSHAVLLRWFQNQS